MHAIRSTRRVGLVNTTRIFLLVLVTKLNMIPLCSGFDLILADGVIDGLHITKGHLQGKQDGSVLAALYLEKECSNEFWECQEPGALPDSTDLRCFSICIAIDTGCRGCCPDNTCYQPAAELGSLGECGQCPDDGDYEGCGPAYSDIEIVLSSSRFERVI
jgi:hypothetical protein